MALTVVTLREDTRDATLGVSVSTFPRQKPILTNIQPDGTFARVTGLDSQHAWYIVAVAALGTTPKGVPTTVQIADLHAADGLPYFISKTRPLTLVVTADAALADRARLVSVREATKLVDGRLSYEGCSSGGDTALLVAGAAPTAANMDVPAGAWCVVAADPPQGLLAGIAAFLRPAAPATAGSVEPATSAAAVAAPDAAPAAAAPAAAVAAARTTSDAAAAPAAAKSPAPARQHQQQKYQLWEMLFGPY